MQRMRSKLSRFTDALRYFFYFQGAKTAIVACICLLVVFVYALWQWWKLLLGIVIALSALGWCVQMALDFPKVRTHATEFIGARNWRNRSEWKELFKTFATWVCWPGMLAAACILVVGFSSFFAFWEWWGGKPLDFETNACD